LGGTAIDIALGLLGVVVLIGLHGAFVAAEFGLVSVDRAAIESKAEAGDFRARGVLEALGSLSTQLSGAQLGITVTSLVVGFLAEPAIAPAIEPLARAIGVPETSSLAVSVTVALVIATAVEMVTAELIPKNIAIARPIGVALTMGNFQRLFTAVFRPLIVFLNKAANATVRLFGIEPREELMPTRSLQELELLIHSSRQRGALLEDEFFLLAKSISFAERDAGEVLVPRTSIVATQRDATLADLASLAVESGHSRFPVYGENLDDIVGVAHVKDIYQWPPAQRGEVTVDAMASPALLVPESRDLESLLIELRRERRQLAVVLDEYGGTAGIVSIEDILEEIVGEIEDEFDIAEPAQMTAPVPPGVHVLSGLMHADEVKDATSFEMPDGPYDTLGGFLLWLLGRIPERGDHVSYEDWEFKIVELDGNRIDKILLVAPSGRTPDEADGS
jgi:CBS domain containing-hemolysin-like protein